MSRPARFHGPRGPRPTHRGLPYDARIVHRIACGLGLEGRGYTVYPAASRRRRPGARCTSAHARRLLRRPARGDRRAGARWPAGGGDRASGRLALVALVPTARSRTRAASKPVLRRCLLASERAALAAVRLAITTSAFTARRLLDFGLRTERIRWVEPGVAPLSLAAADGEPPRLLCVGSLTPRKGQDVLVRALARVRELPWQCTLIGSRTRHPAYASAVAELVRATGLEDRIQLAGEWDDTALHQAYAAADLFVLPSHHEGYGMVVAEALAAGLPVLSTTGGALAATLPAGAGVAVPSRVPSMHSPAPSRPARRSQPTPAATRRRPSRTHAPARVASGRRSLRRRPRQPRRQPARRMNEAAPEPGGPMEPDSDPAGPHPDACFDADWLPCAPRPTAPHVRRASKRSRRAGCMGGARMTPMPRCAWSISAAAAVPTRAISHHGCLDRNGGPCSTTTLACSRTPAADAAASSTPTARRCGSTRVARTWTPSKRTRSLAQTWCAPLPCST